MLRCVIIVFTAGLIFLSLGGCFGIPTGGSRNREAALKRALAEARQALAKEREGREADRAGAEKLAKEWGDMQRKTEFMKEEIRNLRKSIEQYKVMMVADRDEARKVQGLMQEQIDTLKVSLSDARKSAIRR